MNFQLSRKILVPLLSLMVTTTVLPMATDNHSKEALEILSCTHSRTLNRFASLLYEQYFMCEALQASLGNHPAYTLRTEVLKMIEFIEHEVKKSLKTCNRFKCCTCIKNNNQILPLALFHALRELGFGHIFIGTRIDIDYFRDIQELSSLSKLIDIINNFQLLEPTFDCDHTAEACSNFLAEIQDIIQYYFSNRQTTASLYTKIIEQMRTIKQCSLTHAYFTAQKRLLPNELYITQEQHRAKQPIHTHKHISCQPLKKEDLNRMVAFIEGKQAAQKPAATTKSGAKQHPIQITQKKQSKQAAHRSAQYIIHHIDQALSFQERWFKRLQATVHDAEALQASLKELVEEYSQSTVLRRLLNSNETDEFHDLRHIDKILNIACSLKSRRLALPAVLNKVKHVIQVKQIDQFQNQQLVETARACFQ